MNTEKINSMLTVIDLRLQYWDRMNILSPEQVTASRERYQKIAQRIANGEKPPKRVTDGLLQAVRDIAAETKDWPRELRDEFNQAVTESTGLPLFEISGHIESTISRILAGRSRISDADIRMLHDYVADYPEGALLFEVESALEKLDG